MDTESSSYHPEQLPWDYGGWTSRRSRKTYLGYRQADSSPESAGDNYLQRPQALAAVGQCRLMTLYDSLFEHLRQPIAQVLLTRNDIADRTQYQNAQNTFAELLNIGVVPIVNENDTLAVSEIRFGDNDTLSAITAAMVQADYLFLMTDVDCLYDKNPRTNLDAQPIDVVEDIASLEADVSSAGSALGTGGMSTKLVAARLATSAGVTTVITRSSKPGNITDIVTYCQSLKKATQEPLSQPLTPVENGSLSNSVASLHMEALTTPPLHTRFLPDMEPIRDRSFWLLYGLAAYGTVFIDEGAYRALKSKAGLLPVGVVGVEGHFSQQEAVRLVVVPSRRAPPAVVANGDSPTPSSTSSTLVDTQGKASTETKEPLKDTAVKDSEAKDPEVKDPVVKEPAMKDPIEVKFPIEIQEPIEVGRALVTYSASEIQRIKGLQSAQIESVLGYADSEYVALRENISLIKRERAASRAAASSNASVESLANGRLF
ncbi:MAG: hypothetical protein Q9222_002930 [Ikaeria aurantiellina]